MRKFDMDLIWEENGGDENKERLVNGNRMEG